MNRKILFMTQYQKYVPMFWNDVCEAKCREYGFSVDLPSRDGDLENPDWRNILSRYDAVVTTWQSPVCTAEFLREAPSVKVIGHCAGSVAAVVDETTYDTGVQVTTANPVMAEAVAEWSLMATLVSQRNLPYYAHLRKHETPNWADPYNMNDLKHMTIGLWGMGDTSRHLLRFLAPLRPGRILVCSKHASEQELAQYGAHQASLEELLRESDIFHCLVGVTPDTLRRLGTAEFSMMKDGAVRFRSSSSNAEVSGNLPANHPVPGNKIRQGSASQKSLHEGFSAKTERRRFFSNLGLRSYRNSPFFSCSTS